MTLSTLSDDIVMQCCEIMWPSPSTSFSRKQHFIGLRVLLNFLSLTHSCSRLLLSSGNVLSYSMKSSR